MNIQRAFYFIFGLLCFGLTGLAVAEITEGKDYTVLSPAHPVESDAQHIEIIEFFWYGCPHCNDLNPHLHRWLENKPTDVEFRYVPAIFRDSWAPGAKIFYTLESMGLTQPLHDRVYNAIHREKINLSKDAILFDWIERQGISRDEFISVYNSFTVQNQTNRAAQIIRQYGLRGVPALIIDGRYVTSGKAGGLPQDTISVLEQLIEKVRKERKGL